MAAVLVYGIDPDLADRKLFYARISESTEFDRPVPYVVQNGITLPATAHWLLPLNPGGSDSELALDVGAGTGRDAAWPTSLGNEVVAAEPAAAMRRIAADRHGSYGIR